MNCLARFSSRLKLQIQFIKHLKKSFSLSYIRKNVKECLGIRPDYDSGNQCINVLTSLQTPGISKTAIEFLQNLQFQ